MSWGTLKDGRKYKKHEKLLNVITQKRIKEILNSDSTLASLGFSGKTKSLVAYFFEKDEMYKHSKYWNAIQLLNLSNEEKFGLDLMIHNIDLNDGKLPGEGSKFYYGRPEVLTSPVYYNTNAGLLMDDYGFIDKSSKKKLNDLDVLEIVHSRVNPATLSKWTTAGRHIKQ
jgi:hypothetical protein